ncbi:MAG: beta-lactamase family protein [Mariniblastus sp.]|nr:beta-lactamase family protein [Mariniblastus sp.]
MSLSARKWFRLLFASLAAQAIGLGHYGAGPIAWCQSTPAQVEGLQQADGFDAGRLDRINSVMNRGVEAGTIPGCSALVFKDGKEVFFNTWGYQDMENEIPISRDTLFRIYSMTKPITSVAAMQLVEQGKMSLDDPVSKHLKEFQNLQVADLKSDKTEEGELATVPPRRAMTVRDLLRHTSGLSYGFFDRDHPVDQVYMQRGVMIFDRNIAETVEKLGKIPLKHHPGSRFEYSASSDVLGRLVEVVSGERFDRYLQKHLFDPLDMKDTHFLVPEQKRDRLAVMYRDNRNGELVPVSSRSSRRYVSDSNEFFSGGGGLCSTIDDYLNFSRMLINDGQFEGRQIIKPATLKEMFTNQLATLDSPSRGFQFGLGFRISRQRSGEDFSWGGIAGTRFWVHPELKMISLYMIQVNPYGQRAFGERVRSTAYGALED